MVLLAIRDGEIKETLELMEIIRQERGVICLAYSSHRDTKDACSKATVLGSRELLVVVNFVIFTAIWPPLLNAQLVLDGAHGQVFPLTKC